MKPTVHLLGKTMNYAQLSEMGYTLQIQVKPYLSKDQFVPFVVNLTHSPNGRFKNALTKARKNSSVHATGVFFFVEDQLYCEILEFQFVSGKIESDNTITVPWKAKSDSHSKASSSTPKSPMERRISLLRQNLTTQPPSSTKTSMASKLKSFGTKISNISKSLLSHNHEIHDSDNNQEKVENDEENIDNNVEDNDDNVEDNDDSDYNEEKEVRMTRSKKKKSK